MATYVIEPGKSVINWYGEKKIGRKHHGTIDVKEGKLVVEGDNLRGGRVTVDMATITDLDLQDGKLKNTLETHLKSSDFFDVEKFPTAELVMLQVEGEKAMAELTIKGHTEPSEFPVAVEVEGQEAKLKATMVFDRSKFDVRYGSGKFFKGLGDELIYDEIRIEALIVARQE